MGESRSICAECGTPLSANQSGGLCPKCLAGMCLEWSQSASPSPTPPPDTQTPIPDAAHAEKVGAAALDISQFRSSPSKAVKLTVEAEGKTAELLLDPAVGCTIGRHPDCELRFDDGRISSRHARFLVEHEQLVIEDLGSANGTSIDGIPVSGRTAVRSGQTVALGGSSFKILRVDPANPSGSQPTTGATQNVAAMGALFRRRDLQLKGLLGKGGMGAVYEADDCVIGRSVAVKVLRDDKQVNRDALARFIVEAQISGRLEHPNIVPVYELGANAEGKVFYTMRHVKGATLSSIISDLRLLRRETVRKYPLGTTLTIFQKVCDAVAFAHSRGILHRDLKPDNIMVGEFGEVWVMDWGLAKETRAENPGSTEAISPKPTPPPPIERAETVAGAILGTPFYMAPEQAEGKMDQIDTRTDVYGLGAVLYEILTLRPPILGKSFDLVKARIVSGDIRPPRSFRESKSGDDNKSQTGASAPISFLHCPDGKIPPSLSAVAMKALAVKPGDRYQTVGELQSDVTAYQNGFATSAELPGVATLLKLWFRRHRASAFAAVTVAVLAAAFAVMTLGMWAELRGTSETFFDKCQNLIAQDRFVEALDAIKDAIRLNPKNPEYHFTKANILQTTLRIAEARRAYERAFELDESFPLAKENLDLCKKLERANPSGNELSAASILDLQAALHRQGRTGESIALLKRLLARDRSARQRLSALWEAQLKTAGMDGKIRVDDTGRVEIDLGGSAFVSLAPLTNLPLNSLELHFNQFTNLGVLAGTALEALRIDNTKVSDLSPLRGRPSKMLKRLAVNSTQITDLAPLAGMRLEELDIGNLAVGDLRPIAAMPLRSLSLQNTRVRDLEALRGMDRLTSINLSQTPVSDLSPLAACPIRGLDLSNCDDIRDFSWLAHWRLENLTLREVKRLPDLSLIGGIKSLRNLDFYSASISDLKPLRGLKLYSLRIGRTGVTDLSPLAGMPLNELEISRTKVADLGPLAGMPLGNLDLHTTAVTDLRPLAGLQQLNKLSLSFTRVADLSPLHGLPLRELYLDGCSELKDISLVGEFKETLHRLTIPVEIQDIDLLRSMPNLRWLSYSQNNLLPVREFWKQLDDQKNKKK